LEYFLATTQFRAVVNEEEAMDRREGDQFLGVLVYIGFGGYRGGESSDTILE
jgi:hypothetical protein